jgi:antitoxin component YwqK of YwqJK toxin-antitoxin module
MSKQTKIINICNLNDGIIINIIRYFTNSDDYNNFRMTNKKLYKLINIIRKYENSRCIQEIFIENQYYINKHYFYNNTLKLQNIYIINDKFEKIKTGAEKEYYLNGSLKRISNYKNGLKEGLEKKYFDNYIIRRQSFYKDGIKYRKEFINDFNGILKYILDYNFLYIYVKKFNRKMLCYDISIKNNNLHGECKYYNNGSLQKSINFYNGLMQGIYKIYKLFGLDEIITYNNNKKNGVFLCYNYLKEIKYCGKYKNDRLEGTINFFVSNRIIKSIEMKCGLLHGKYIEYSDLKKHFDFKDNLLTGYYKEYSYTNIIRLKIKFNEDKFDNIFKIYDIQGNLDKEYIFLDKDYIVKKYIRNRLIYSLYKINSVYYLLFNNKKIKLI